MMEWNDDEDDDPVYANDNDGFGGGYEAADFEGTDAPEDLDVVGYDGRDKGGALHLNDSGEQGGGWGASEELYGDAHVDVGDDGLPISGGGGGLRSHPPTESERLLAEQEQELLAQHMCSILQSRVVASAQRKRRAVLDAMGEDAISESLRGILSAPDEPPSTQLGLSVVDMFHPLVLLAEAMEEETKRRQWIEERLMQVLIHRLGYSGDEATMLHDLTMRASVLPAMSESEQDSNGDSPVHLLQADDDEEEENERVLRERMLKNPLLRIRPDGEMEPPEKEEEWEDEQQKPTKQKKSKKTTSNVVEPPEQRSRSIEDCTPSGAHDEDPPPVAFSEDSTRTFEQFFASLVSPCCAGAPLTHDGILHFLTAAGLSRGVVETEEEVQRLMDDGTFLLASECCAAADAVLENWSAAALPAPVPEHLQQEYNEMCAEVEALQRANAEAASQLDTLREAIDHRDKKFHESVAARREKDILLDAAQMREALQQCKRLEAEIVTLASKQHVTSAVEEVVASCTSGYTMRILENDDTIRDLERQIAALESVGRRSGLWAVAKSGQFHRDPAVRSVLKRQDESVFQDSLACVSPVHPALPHNRE